MPTAEAGTNQGGPSADVYWASQATGLPIAEAIVYQVEQYDKFLQTSCLLQLWAMVHERYYRSLRKKDIENVGEQGEFTVVNVNHFRNVLRHLYVQITSARPTMTPRATNDDAQSRATVRLAEGVLDYYHTEKRVERKINRTAELCLLAAEGFQSFRWDASAGEVEAVENQQQDGSGTPLRAGDLDIQVHHPMDVVRDVTRDSWDAQTWVIVRTYRNRWDLMVQYPQQAATIRDLPSRTEDCKSRKVPTLLASWADQHSDDVAVYTLMHERTPSVPNGRVVEVLSREVMLSDSTMDQLEHKSMPLARMCAGDIEGTSFGYSPAYDLLVPQRWRTILDSTIATNQVAFGVNCVQTEAGNNVVPKQISDGLKIIENSKPGAKVEPIQLLNSASELFENREKIDKDMEIVAGVNSVARGQPEASLKSGAALALVQSQFIEFTRDFQASYGDLVGDGGTIMIRIFRKNANTPRMAAIVGEGNRSYLQKIAGKDLAGIDRVVVDMGSYLSRTAAGRINLAEQLMGGGFVKTPEQFMAVLETGRLEPITHRPMAELDLIKAENEAILRGEQPQTPILTENHKLHIEEHTGPLLDPSARENPAALEAGLNHIAEHEQALVVLSTTRPILAAILGQPNVAGAPTPNAPGGAAGAPASESNAVPLPATNPATGEPAQVTPPNNPVTGEDWNPATGGGQLQ